MCFWVYFILTWILGFQFSYCTFTTTPDRSTVGCTGDNVTLTWTYDATSLSTVTWNKDGQNSLRVNSTGNTIFTRNEIDHLSDGNVKINTSTILKSEYSIIVAYTLPSGKPTISDTVNITTYEPPEGISCSKSPDDTFTCTSNSLGSPNVELLTRVNGISIQTTTYQSEFYQCQTIECCYNGPATSCITGSYTPGSTTYCITAQKATTLTCEETYVIIFGVYCFLAIFSVVVLFAGRYISESKINPEKYASDQAQDEDSFNKDNIDNQGTCGNGSMLYASMICAALCIVLWIIACFILVKINVCASCICGYSCGLIALNIGVVLIVTAALIGILSCIYMNFGCFAGNTKGCIITAEVICILLLGMSILGYIGIIILYCRKWWPFEANVFEIVIKKPENKSGPKFIVIYNNKNEKKFKLRDRKRSTNTDNYKILHYMTSFNGFRLEPPGSDCYTKAIVKLTNSKNKKPHLGKDSYIENKWIPGNNGILYAINVSTTKTANCNGTEWFVIFHNGNINSGEVRLPISKTDDKEATQIYNVMVHNSISAVTKLEIGHRGNGDQEACIFGNILVYSASTDLVQHFDKRTGTTRYLFTETITEEKQKIDRDVYVVNFTTKRNINKEDGDVYLDLQPGITFDKPVKVWLPRVNYKPGEINKGLVPLNRGEFDVKNIHAVLSSSASSLDLELRDVAVRCVKTDHPRTPSTPDET